MIFTNKFVVAPILVAFGRGAPREERAIARAQRSSRIVRPGPLDLYARNEGTNGPLSPSSVPLLSALALHASALFSHIPSRSSTFPPATRSFALATFLPAPASHAGDVIHACDATRIVLPHRHTGVELCRIRSRLRIHLSAITCPLGGEKEEEDDEEEEEANRRLIGSWGLGSSIGDLANTARALLRRAVY